MKKKNWETVLKLIAFCEASEPKLDYMNTLNQLANGEAEFDGENLTWKERKLSKKESDRAEMSKAAHESIEKLMQREDFASLKVDTVIRLVCSHHTQMYIDYPKIFKGIIREVLQLATKPSGIILQEGKIRMKESEINPAMREWAIKNGIEITPLPEQCPHLQSL